MSGAARRPRVHLAAAAVAMVIALGAVPVPASADTKGEPGVPPGLKLPPRALEAVLVGPAELEGFTAQDALAAL